MNIFEVFNKGDASLREVAYTAWLGYLLNPAEDHGLSYQFLDAFLLELDQENQSKSLQAFAKADINNRFVDVRLEPVFEGNKDGKKNKPDIFITLSILPRKRGIMAWKPSENEDETHHILIENKVKVDSASVGQLSRYAKHLEKYDGGKTLVFLTPDDNKFEEQIVAETAKYKFNSVWLKWKDSYSKDERSDDAEPPSFDMRPNDIVSIIQDLINKEGNGETAPMNYYLKHTLKSLIYTINHNPSFFPKSNSQDGKYSRRFKELRDKWNIVAQAGQLREKLKISLPEIYPNFADIFSIDDVNIDNPRFTCIRLSAEEIDRFEIDIGLSHAELSSVFAGIRPKNSSKKGEIKKRKDNLVKLCEDNPDFQLVPKNKGEYAKLANHGRAETIDKIENIVKRIAELCNVLVKLK